MQYGFFLPWNTEVSVYLNNLSNIMISGYVSDPLSTLRIPMPLSHCADIDQSFQSSPPSWYSTQSYNRFPYYFTIIWAWHSKNYILAYLLCKDCTSMQSDQSLHYPYERAIHRVPGKDFWSDGTAAQADLSLCWVHIPSCTLLIWKIKPYCLPYDIQHIVYTSLKLCKHCDQYFS